MDAAVHQVSLFNPSSFITTTSSNKRSYPRIYTRQLKLPIKHSAHNNLRYCCGVASNFNLYQNSRCNFNSRICLSIKGNGVFQNAQDSSGPCLKIRFFELLKKGLVLAAVICGVVVIGCRRVLAVEGVLNGGYNGVIEQSLVLLRSSWPTVLQLLRVFKEQGLVLAALLSLSAFFSMAETSITTLWPWKVPSFASSLYALS